MNSSPCCRNEYTPIILSAEKPNKDDKTLMNRNSTSGETNDSFEVCSRPCISKEEQGEGD